jgi:hypothetical protein
MKSKDKLVLLADRLDKKGLAAEAALVDRVIVKRSFDEGNRADIDSVTTMIRQDIGELIKASQGLGSDLQDIFLDKLNRINDATSYLGDLNALSAEDEESGLDVDALSPSETTAVAEEGEAGLSNWWDSLS